MTARESEFPALDFVLDESRREADFREMIRHNVDCWRRIHGGLALASRSPVDFDPFPDYWARTERRVLVSFFARRFREAYCPAEAMRRLAFKVFRHFDAAREAGSLGRLEPATEADWPAHCDRLLRVAGELAQIAEYAEVAAVWPRKRRESFREEFTDFLKEHRDDASPEDFSPALVRRLPWFPYLGLGSLDELYERQRFFYGFYSLFTSTNSYAVGGALAFAPVLQNNPMSELMDYATGWAEGDFPPDTGFEVMGTSERRDYAHHAPVVEMVGFLHLHRLPFYNKQNSKAFEAVVPEAVGHLFHRLSAIGQRTRKYLEGRPAEVERLAGRFQDLLHGPLEAPRVTMEGIRLKKVSKAHLGEEEKLADHRLREELRQAALLRARDLDPLDAATALLHVMIDGVIYLGLWPPKEDGGESLRLPPSLLPVANDALGYLKAGYHVLFAGPPGTGKTTVAQFVGHAWNEELKEVKERIPRPKAPLTTVGNSAWAPFHTIGGLLPKESGEFGVVKGIFIEPGGGGSEWSLRREAVVLDEMNRADLDRCIGELYPLLSGSVERVRPAGIPEVEAIRLDRRFRLIATVNDATLDDVVFPISEGLARRFIRLELRGGRMEELRTFVASGEAIDERADGAFEALDRLFEILDQHTDLAESETGTHLPFGVGYFSVLRSWVSGDLELSSELSQLEPEEQAKRLILTALRAAGRVRGLEEVIEELVTGQAPE